MLRGFVFLPFVIDICPINAYLYSHTQTIKVMEFLIFAIVAFIVFIAAVISGMKEVEKKQTEEKNIAYPPVRIQWEGKFVKTECSINDTLIDFEVKVFLSW